MFDFDKQPKSLTGHYKTRWQAIRRRRRADGKAWTTDFNTQATRRAGSAINMSSRLGSEQARIPPVQPAEINDHLAYNAPQGGSYWVPDLIVECRAEFGSASDKLTLELNKANDKFQAIFEDGICKLFRVNFNSPDSHDRWPNSRRRSTEAAMIFASPISIHA